MPAAISRSIRTAHRCSRARVLRRGRTRLDFQLSERGSRRQHWQAADVVAAIVPKDASSLNDPRFFENCKSQLEAAFVRSFIQAVTQILKAASEKPLKRLSSGSRKLFIGAREPKASSPKWWLGVAFSASPRRGKDFDC